uniref:Nuclear pore complex interacting protein N-terminal domain-containing protein n=1 Tax=Nothoprocta perdicaria TaxID=30464 RepID=A0A8C6Z807_NOTPE
PVSTGVCPFPLLGEQEAVASLPEEMRPGPDLDGFPWEIVICAGVVGIFTVFLFLYRSYQSVSIQGTYRCETHEKLNKSNLELKQEIENLEKELEEEKSKHSENDELVRAKSTLKVFEINTERLKTSAQDAAEENCHLQESEKQLLQEAEGWGERFTELNEQTKMSESSKADMEEVLKNKESQIKSLTQYLLKMKDWSSAVREDDSTEDNHWDTDIKGEGENGEHLGKIWLDAYF